MSASISIILPLLLALTLSGVVECLRPRDFICNGVLNPVERRGVCGRPLYYMTASYCCWYCNALSVIKRNPERLFDVHKGDTTHFNFTQCRHPSWDTSLVRLKKRSIAGRQPPVQDSVTARVHEQMRKLDSLNRSRPWQIVPSGTDLHCDCCVNSCPLSHLSRYCSCMID